MQARNIIAILRGITDAEIIPAVEILLEAGITKIEVPLNSPDPFVTIEKMINNFKGKNISNLMLGAGTVLTVADVKTLASLGADMVVSPNFNGDVVRATKLVGMASFPGVMTPSEAFAALDAGADALKFFPGDVIGPKGIKAVKAVLPKGTDCIAVGGAGPNNFDEWFRAGATGFGIGSAIYTAGMSMNQLQQNAENIISAYDQAKNLYLVQK